MDFVKDSTEIFVKDSTEIVYCQTRFNNDC